MIASHQGAELANTSRKTSRTGIPHTMTVRRTFLRDSDRVVCCIPHYSSGWLASRAFRSAPVTSCNTWISARRERRRRSWAPATRWIAGQPLVYDAQQNELHPRLRPCRRRPARAGRGAQPSVGGQPPPSQHDSIFWQHSLHHHAECIQRASRQRTQHFCQSMRRPFVSIRRVVEVRLDGRRRSPQTVAICLIERSSNWR